VATLTLDSPTNRNALSTPLIEELLAALAAADADGAVRAVVLTHAGPVFCSGADLKETAAAFGSGRPPINRLGEVLAAIWESRKPVVARVTGPARAGGLGLIAAADIAVCSADATFGFSEVRIGVVPAVISATVLPRLSGRAAAELYLTGATFDGVRAAQIGLVTAAVDAGLVDAAVEAYLRDLVRGAPGALAGTKEILRRRRADTFREDLAALTEISVGYFGSTEGMEGIMAFRDKRDPNWISDGVG
jgi:methylglutaconyl-CoA hydratase